MTRLMLALLITLALAGSVLAAEAPVSGTKEATPPKTEAAKVSVAASDTKITDVFTSLAKQTKDKIVVESAVKGKITLSIKEASLDDAVAAVCKSGKLEWRKIYIAPDTKLLEQPDRFAATVRLMSGLSFPNLVLADSSVSKVGIHCEDKKAVTATVDTIAKELGLVRVYLITNDAALAAKALAANEKEREKESPVRKYTDMTLEMVDMFMKMSPEDREDALMEGLNVLDQMDPRYMSTVMQTMMRADPDALKKMVAKQTQVLFEMSEEERRSILRMNISIGNMLTPEQQQMLRRDAEAIAKEMLDHAPK